MKKITILLLLFLLAIVQAQAQIDSIKLVDTTTDSLVFAVHFTISSSLHVDNVEYEKDTDAIKINILYSLGFIMDCYCPEQTIIKIKKNSYQKAIVSIAFRYPIGGGAGNPIYSDDYKVDDSMEIDLANITSIFNPAVSNKVSIFPNPAQNVFYVNIGENKTADLEIYDIHGSLLLRKDVTSGKGIDVSSLSSGLYVVLIDRKYIGNIIKE